MSSTGSCFDIGNTVAGALRRFQQTGEPYSGSTDPYTAGNGSIMRLAPVPMMLMLDTSPAIPQPSTSALTAHQPVSNCHSGTIMDSAMQVMILQAIGSP